ncbi:MAG: hypothetical protein QXL78_07375 [Methanocellales archaeon]
MCDWIDCRHCRTVNYIDPWYFWNWEGKIACAECGTVYYIKYENGLAAPGTPKELPKGEKPDELVLYADKPLNGYEFIRPGTPGKTRPYICLMRDPATYTGKARRIWKSIRGKPLRGAPQVRSDHLAGSHFWEWKLKGKVESYHPDVRKDLISGETGLEPGWPKDVEVE